jgi:hypothetical protein
MGRFDIQAIQLFRKFTFDIQAIQLLRMFRFDIQAILLFRTLRHYLENSDLTFSYHGDFHSTVQNSKTKLVLAQGIAS